MTEELKFNYESADATLIVWEDGRATLSSLYSYQRGKGHAKVVMQRICNYADDHDLTLILTAAPYGQSEPRLNDLDLQIFYSKFGFKSMNEINPEDMVRNPFGW